MLENAGAVVFTPRERDWQTEEYIVDPDGGLNSTADDYKEYSEMGPWQSTGRPGFAAHGGSYVDGQNPFTDGQCRMLEASKKADKAFVKYQPTFRKAGRYAVYVSYQTVPGSVDDAHYTVFHRGQATELRVNQQMGGGTWVYLGTFDFDAGNNIYNCVMLTNQSRRRGVVTADAVRFGGGRTLLGTVGWRTLFGLRRTRRTGRLCRRHQHPLEDAQLACRRLGVCADKGRTGCAHGTVAGHTQ